MEGPPAPLLHRPRKYGEVAARDEIVWPKGDNTAARPGKALAIHREIP